VASVSGAAGDTFTTCGL